jgi:hypothetical protein
MLVKLNIKWNNLPLYYNIQHNVYIVKYTNIDVNVTHQIITKFGNILPNLHFVN